MQLLVISHRIVAKYFLTVVLHMFQLIMAYSSCEYLHMCLVSFCMQSVIIVLYLVFEIQLFLIGSICGQTVSTKHNIPVYGSAQHKVSMGTTRQMECL